MADKVTSKELGIDQVSKDFEQLTKLMNISAESMSAFIDEAIRLKPLLDSSNLTKYTEAQSQLNKTYDQSKITEKELLQIQQERQKVILNDIKIKNQQEAQQRKSNKETENFTAILNREIHTIKQAEQKIRDLNKARKELNLTSWAGSKANEKAIKELDRLNKFTVMNADSETKRTKTIGLYRQQLDGMKVSLENSTGSVGRFIGSFAKFGGIGLGIGAALAALSAPFVAFFKYTEEGMDMISAKMAGARSAMNVLSLEIIKIGKSAVNAFGDSDKESTFWSSTLKTVATLLAGIGNLMPSVRAKINEIGKAMDDAQKAGESADKIRDMLEDQEVMLIVKRAEANEKLVNARLKASDEEIPLRERIKLFKDAFQLENETASTEIEHQKKRVENLKQINLLLGAQVDANGDLQMAGLFTIKEMEEYQRAIARVMELQGESERRQTKGQKMMLAMEKQLIKEREDAAKKKAEDEKKRMDELESMVDAELVLQSNRIEQEKAQSKELTTEWEISYKKKYDAAKESNDGIELSEKKFLQSELNTMIASVDNLHLSLDEKAKLVEAYKNMRKALSKDSTDYEIANEEKVLEKKLETLRKVHEYGQQGLDVVNGFLENEKIAVEQTEQSKINAIDARLARDLMAAGNNEEKKKQLQEKADADKLKIQQSTAKKIAEIERKQTIMDKIKGVAEVAYNTSVSISKAWAASPLTFGLPWSAAAAVMGALQAAVILSKPLPEIPKYAKGGIKKETGYALVSEEGREGMKYQGKMYITPDVPTVMNIPAGAEIIPNKIIEKELTRFDSKITENIEIIQLGKDIKSLVVALKNKPETYISMDENAFRIHARKGNNWTEYLNRNFRHKC